MRSLLSWAIVAALTIALLEIGLRVLFRAQLGDARSHVQESERAFFQRDPAVGWSPTPGAAGTFTNGVYRSHVHIDARGARLNAGSSTWDPGAPTIFVIGDSNAGGFEVDDEDSLPALLEKRLRAQGKRVNVLNLGVRDYGTDQAVLRALSFRDLAPRVVLYLFTNNDPFDNNLLHLPGRALGKGAFIRRAGEAEFSAYHYPVPDYPLRDVGVVLLDHHCEPVVHERTVREEAPRPSLSAWSKQNFWTARAVSYLRRPPQRLLLDDPVDLILDAGRDFHPDLYITYHEQGAVRTRCAEYFEAQMASLLARLREMPSVEKVFVASYPDNEIFDDLAAGRTLPSMRAFDRLRAAGVIDRYLNLSQKFVEAGLSYPALACPGDGHFCRDGIRWEADEIFRAFGPELAP